ncbi:Polysaccharide lyase family 8, N terminal alpha-helical domain [Rhizoctonia solani]|uniref:Polysaccharide lyase family 8, N terminal alpha-helical domain n=1 Tax=Rhizoctonia solani TaxID=456999 RepID=A0A8H7I704_9AGAM|nr:Polysaccharide lyase family 8, N terminal alpha-helical domain [Rhizoctonia solani]
MLGVLTGVTPVAVLLGTLSRVTLARADDLQTLYDRRVTSIISGASTSKSKVDNLLNTLQPNGTWASVNYASGCDSQRASWPAGLHWSNIVSMAAAYKGKVAQYKDDPHLLSSIQLAMGFWFANEMSTVGDGTCMDANISNPTTVPPANSLFVSSNVIQVPDRVGQTCNMLRSELTESELGNCTLITSRAFSTFYRETPPSYLTGANVIDISAIGICAGLLDNNKAGNSSKIMDAYQNIHNQVVVESAPRVDGIKPDGSFQQHKGIIFDGNYGKDLYVYVSHALDRANKTVQDTFGFHLDGSRWMTFTNTLSKVVHWILVSLVGSYPILSRTLLALRPVCKRTWGMCELGNAWGQQDLIEFGTVLSQAANESSVNSAKLTGSRVFWSSDYVVHRTDQTVTTVKMLSSRTSTSRCTNSEGPYTFHLSDGAVYTYTTGAEYEDMFAALDYDIIPAPRRKVDAYAGGVEAKDVGMAAMRYVNPTSKAFRFYRAWFFFPDNVQHVLVSNVEQTNPNSTSPVYSVLDQRLRSGDVYVNGSPISGSAEKVDAKSIWHAGTGYAFPTSGARTPKVSVRLETRTGDWTKLGASKVVATPKDMFAAWIPHQTLTLNPSPNATNSGPGKYTPAEYSVFPATASYEDFKDKATRLGPRTIVNTGTVSAAIDSSARILGAAFWKAGGGYFTVNDMGIKIEVDRSVVLMLKFTDDGRTKGTVSVADPTQGSGKVNIKITSVGSSKKRGHYQRLLGHHGQHIPRVKRTTETSSAGCSLTLDLPAGALAGSTVTGEFSYSG